MPPNILYVCALFKKKIMRDSAAACPGPAPCQVRGDTPDVACLPAGAGGGLQRVRSRALAQEVALNFLSVALASCIARQDRQS